GELINDPTLKPTQDFSACRDVDILLPADKKEYAIVMFHRTYKERKQIEECFNEKHGSETTVTLIGALQLTSDYGLKSLYAESLQPPEWILGDMIYGTITSDKSEMGGIEEVVCANDKQMKDLIDVYYQQSKFTKNILMEMLSLNGL
ncbi:hypothetical protein U1Q18_050488, partial [Sarracenia purpurea var. burkii]